MMVQFGVCKRIMIAGPLRENHQQYSCIDEEEEDGALTADSPQKRKTPLSSSSSSSSMKVDKRVAVPVWSRKQKRTRGGFGGGGGVATKNTKRGFKNINRKEKPKPYTSRWTTDRYKVAEESMFRIMKDEGAVSGNPISRSKLRSMGRTYIGDTGLLDHLLKHMEGKVAPGGNERFRRRHNFEGTMEYWLENADLVNIRHEAGIEDPFWIPPPGWTPGDCPLSQDFLFAVELKLLKEEMAKVKRDFQELVSKKQDEDQANATPSSSFTYQNTKIDSSFLHSQEMLNLLPRWKSKIEQELMEISSTLSGMQENYEDLDKWKAKIEQKLTEASNSLSSFQVSNQYSSFNPSASESWKDWFGSTDLITHSKDFSPWLESGDLFYLKPEDLAPWLESSDMVDIKPELTLPNPVCVPAPEWELRDSSSEDPVCAKELKLLKEEMTKMKRDIRELIPKKEEDSETNVTSDSSSVVTNSKLDLDNSLLMLQDMYKGVVNWKARIEQQVTEISKTLSGMQA